MAALLTVTDFHSHILPALDHGCEDLDQCIEQLAIMKKHGTDIAVATSHFYPQQHSVPHFLEKVEWATQRMKAASICDAPRITIGAEVLLCANIHAMPDFDKLCIRGTRTILLELPMRQLDDRHIETVEQILSQGYTVVLAHIDRYLDDLEDEIDTLLSMGALAQVNAHSLSRGAIKKKILSYLESGDKICALGSDLHGDDEGAYKKFVKASKLLKEHYPIIMKRTASLLEGAQFLEL